MIKKTTLEFLKNKKNLLAFSYGVDSTALFYLLREYKIPFDIAMIDYQIREESKEEIQKGKKLALNHKKKFFSKTAQKFTSNFEKKARDFRYQFFLDLIQEEKYTTLLTAHQLNDKLEWFLMELSKGAGTCELSGMQEVEKRENFYLVRPLLSTPKHLLKEYLDKSNHLYFIDKTNKDEEITRNYFRENFSDPFMEQFYQGVKRSFEYLEKDKQFILKDYTYKKIQDLYILERKESHIEIKEIELTTKKLGYILSKPQKDEIEKQEECVIGHSISISKTEKEIFICPFITPERMEKKFKESCRVLKIPKKIRGYLYEKKIDLKTLFS